MSGPKKPAALRVVDQSEGAAPAAPKDIYAKDKARIAATNWAAVHIRGDRSEPIWLPSRIIRRFLSRGGFQFEISARGHSVKER